MKIIEVRHFVNALKMINEEVTLSQIRKGLLGKDHHYPIKDEDWLESNKKEFMKLLDMSVGNETDKNLSSKMRKWKTDNYFTKDKPRRLDAERLYKDLQYKYATEIGKLNYKASRGSDTMTNQYEMKKIGDDVEVYAVYTPEANVYLAHTKLRTKTVPGWCIASSSANHYWNDSYRLSDSDYPSVYIVAQKKNGTYNDWKYELACNPDSTKKFAEGKMGLEDLIDEWRDPLQNEEEMDETSLFKRFKITEKQLEETIRSLMLSEKGKKYAENYSNKYFKEIEDRLRKCSNVERIEILVNACKMGNIIRYKKFIKPEEKNFILRRLIDFNNLFENVIDELEIKITEEIVDNLIKNKRCTMDTAWNVKEELNGDEKLLMKIFDVIPPENYEAATYDIFVPILDKNRREKLIKYTREKKYYFLTSLLVQSQYLSEDEIKYCIDGVLEASKNGNINSDAIASALDICFRNKDTKSSDYLSKIIIKNGYLNFNSLILMFDYNSPMKEKAFEKYMKHRFSMENVSWMLNSFVKKQLPDKVKLIIEKALDKGNLFKMNWKLFMFEVVPFLLEDKSHKEEYVEYALRLANEKIKAKSEIKDFLDFFIHRSKCVKKLPNSFFEVCEELDLYGGKEGMERILNFIG